MIEGLVFSDLTSGGPEGSPASLTGEGDLEALPAAVHHQLTALR